MTEFQSAAEKLEFKKILGRLESYASSDLGKNAAEHVVPTGNLSLLAQELNRVDEMKKLSKVMIHFHSMAFGTSATRSRGPASRTAFLAPPTYYLSLRHSRQQEISRCSFRKEKMSTWSCTHIAKL